MPSPFPGMDPYLEGELWQTFHAQLVPEIARLLQPKLSPKYIARTQKRYVVVSPQEMDDFESVRYPDIDVREWSHGSSPPSDTEIAPPPLVMATVVREEIPHVWLEIREARKRKLVTAIEVLSPVNKQGSGRAEYLEKRDEFLHSSAHLLEIDLLRRGHRLPTRKRLPSVDYFVFLSRTKKRPLTEIWPLVLANPLPIVPVPLLNDDPDVGLPLQQALTNVYDICRYDIEIDYRQPPDVPLSKDKSAWANRLLRAADKR